MVLDAKHRQKKLAKKLAKRKAQLSDKRAKSGSDGTYPLMQAARLPVHECLVPANLFEVGIGSVILSRSLPTGELALAMFLVDVYCLGVKNALYRILSQQEYALYVEQTGESSNLDRVHPSCLRKLVEGAVHYARGLGFTPHSDYGRAAKLFGDVDAMACPVGYRYGKDGKPLYVSGPHESPAQSRRIIDTLTRRLGPDEFHFVTALGTHEDAPALAASGGELMELDYEITTDPLETPGYARLPESLRDQLQEFYDGGLTRRPKIVIARVRPLIEQYPDVPQPYNYLYQAYRVLGDQANAERVLKETRRRFPDYLFGRIAYANECLQRGELDQVTEVFAGKYELKLLYPDRNRFHISEAVGFYSTMAWYFHGRGNHAQADFYYKLLQQFDPDHQSTRFIKRLLYPSRLQNWLRNKLLPRGSRANSPDE